MVHCNDCKSDCCGYIAIEIDEPETLDDFDELRWFLAHENVRVYLDNDGDWIVEFRTRCKHLDASQYRCTTYETRPNICRNHGMDECVQNGEGEVEQILFESMEDVERYVKDKFPGQAFPPR